MNPAHQALIDLVVASLRTDSAFDGLPIYESWNTTERAKPSLIVSTLTLDSAHPQLRTLELTLEYLSNRNDTPAGVAHGLQSALENHIENQAFTIATALYEVGWQVHVFNLTAPIDELEGEKDWRTGQEYRVVLAKI